MQSASKLHDQVIKAEFAASETFFDNTTSFYARNSVLNTYSERRNFPVFFFLLIRKFFSFWLLDRHAQFYVLWIMPQKAQILPKSNARRKPQGLFITHFFIVNAAVRSLSKPKNPSFWRTQHVIFYTMSFFYHCNRIFVCRSAKDAQ